MLGVTFQNPTGYIHCFDQITIGSCTFDVAVTLSERNSDPSAIHGGRIVEFELTCEGDLVAYYDYGTWYNYPEDDFGEALLAITAIIEKWRRRN